MNGITPSAAIACSSLGAPAGVHSTGQTYTVNNRNGQWRPEIATTHRTGRIMKLEIRTNLERVVKQQQKESATPEARMEMRYKEECMPPPHRQWSQGRKLGGKLGGGRWQTAFGSKLLTRKTGHIETSDTVEDKNKNVYIITGQWPDETEAYNAPYLGDMTYRSTFWGTCPPPDLRPCRPCVKSL